MNSMISQWRVRFSGAGQQNTEEPSSSFRERRASLQKTQSFKGEAKRTLSWFHKRFLQQMSQEYDSSKEREHATAVAATAFVITSLEESSNARQRTSSHGDEPSLTKQKTRKAERTISIGGSGRISRQFSGEGSMKRSTSLEGEVPGITPTAIEDKQREKATRAPSIRKSSTFRDELLNKSDDEKAEKTTEKVTGHTPSLRKTAHEKLKRTTSVESEISEAKTDLPPSKPPPKPNTFPTLKLADSWGETTRENSTRPRKGEAIANSWERAEMAKIKKRYERLIETIASWEYKKMKKARSKFDKSEGDLEEKRTKALQKYRRDMEIIDQIAGGARAQAEAKRRNEELKAKEKANKIRTTGKVPSACSCF